MNAGTEGPATLQEIRSEFVTLLTALDDAWAFQAALRTQAEAVEGFDWERATEERRDALVLGIFGMERVLKAVREQAGRFESRLWSKNGLLKDG